MNLQHTLWQSGTGTANGKAWPFRLWALALAAFWGLVSFRPFTESDVFWHLMLGRAVLEHGRRTVPEPAAWDNFAPAVTAQEWLWDVLTYQLWLAGSWTALGLLWIALAALTALLCCWLARTWAPKLSLGYLVLITTAISPMVLVRIKERPETAALALLLITMIVGQALEQATEKRQSQRLAIGLVALTAAWVQLHPTAIIAPVVTAIILASPLFFPRNRWHGTAARSAIVGMVIALFSGAHGTDIFANIWAHAQGDAIQYIIDMEPVSWAHFDPSGPVHLPLYGLCLLSGWILALRLRPFPWREVFLSLLGFTMVITANRGVGPAAILLLPLLAHLGSRLPLPVAWQSLLSGVFTVFCVYIGAQTYAFYQTPPGPGFRLAKAEFPLTAAKLLRRVPAGSKVLSSYQAGAPLGFLLEGKVRTFVDSRTPLVFDDADLALARTIWNNKEAVEHAALHYGFNYVVTERQSVLCKILAKESNWATVMVEPGFTTFARRSETMSVPPLTSFAACGAELVKRSACGEDGGATLKQEIEWLNSIQAGPFVNMLSAEHLARCEGNQVSAQAILDYIPKEANADGFQRSRSKLLAWLYASNGRIDAAIELVTPFAETGDAGILRPIIPMLNAPPYIAQQKELLAAVFAARHDSTPAWIYAALATACAQTDDADCAAFHAPRAAALGNIEVGPALCWLSKHHPKDQQKTEAARWLQTMGKEARSANRPLPAPLQCDSP